MDRRWVPAGHVRAATPGKRVIRIKPVRGGENAFKGVTWLKLELADGDALVCRVATIRDDCCGEVLATLVAGVTRDNVARMKGAAVSVEFCETQIPTDVGLGLADVRFNLDDLIGFAVHDVEGTCLGTIVEVCDNGVHGVIEIKTETGLQMFPLIEQTFAAVLQDARVLTVKDLAPYLVGEDLSVPDETDAD